jgi:GNAT superfamily N-acetyltransferase
MPNSVRPARPADAPALAAIQRACWRALLGPEAPAWAETLDAEALAATWRDGIGLARAGGPYGVFAALDAEGAVAGFAAFGPLADPDGARAAELVALWVAPGAQRAGHGSRLLAAVADAVRAAPSLPAPAGAQGQALSADGTPRFTRLSHWVARQDIPRQRFLRGAGFAPDGAERSWRTEAGELIDELRWSALTDPA